MNRKFKVIVADDEKLIARNIARRIEEGCEAFQVIAQAGTGLEALELAGQLMPDVVFSDIKMPEMDGIELIARLREQNPSALCVIVSGYSDFEYARAAIQNSAVDYLLKPVNPEELSALLKRLETMLMAREQALAPRREASAGEVVENVMDHAGTSPSRYLTDLRMQKAKKLLLDSQLSIKEIAARVGYPDPFHFSKSFKNAVGMSPAQFRDQRGDGGKE